MASFDENALARAGEQADAEMIAAAERVAAIIESGGGGSRGDAFADHGVTIVENFPPFIFEGPGSVERWSEQMRAHLMGVTALRHTFGPAQDFSRTGDEVYFSLPTTWRGLKHGRLFVEDGGWAFVLARQGRLWRVRGYGWAVTGSSSTLLGAGNRAPEIVTDRVRIDALTPDDAPVLFDYRSDAEVGRFQSWAPATVDETRAFIVDNASGPFGETGAWYQLAVRSAATGELVGDLGVHFLATDHRQVEIGFTIAPAHQRQGFGRSAFIALLDYLFAVLAKHRVVASVDPRNDPSVALLRTAGLREEAHFRESLLWRGEWVDDVVFALLRSEWNERRASESGGERPS